MAVTGSFSRDANYVPITFDGITTTDSQTLVASNTTATVPIFRITGTVEVTGLYGIVTTDLGNNTAAYWRLNDQTSQINITLNTGTALTNAKKGSFILKNALNTVALVKKDAVAGAYTETAAAGQVFFQRFAVTQKTGGINTDIEFVYTTTDTPTTGAIQFFLRWVPLSSDGNVVAL